MIYPHQERWPVIHETAFIAPSAEIIGDVEIGASSSVWFGSVVRGDVHSIRIGERTNIQDLSVVHVTRRKAPTVVGNEVTVGHRVILHGCTIRDRVLIGMGAVLMDHSEISEDSIVGAGALVTEGKQFPPRSLIMGSPAKRVRELTDEEVAFLVKSAANYVADSNEYRRVLAAPKRYGVDDRDLEEGFE